MLVNLLRIETRLRKLGWNDEDFASDHWTFEVSVARPFSEKGQSDSIFASRRAPPADYRYLNFALGWKSLRPKLELFLRDQRVTRTNKKLGQERDRRLQQLSTAFHKLRSDDAAAQAARLFPLPPFDEFQVLDSVLPLWSLEESEFSEDNFESAWGSISQEIDTLGKDRLKPALMAKALDSVEAILGITFLGTAPSSLDFQALSPGDTPLARSDAQLKNATASISQLAIVVFLCSRCGEFIGNWTKIRIHDCGYFRYSQGGTLKPEGYQVNEDLIRAAAALVTASGKDPQNTSHFEMEDSRKKFTCVREGCTKDLGSSCRNFDQSVSHSSDCNLGLEDGQLTDVALNIFQLKHCHKSKFNSVPHTRGDFKFHASQESLLKEYLK